MADKTNRYKRKFNSASLSGSPHPLKRVRDDDLLWLFPPFLFGFLNALPEIGGLDDFDLFSPRRQMPSHFQRATCAEFHSQSAIFVFDRFLSGVENEVFRFGRGFRGEFPFDVVRFFAVHTERIFYILVHIETNTLEIACCYDG